MGEARDQKGQKLVCRRCGQSIIGNNYRFTEGFSLIAPRPLDGLVYEHFPSCPKLVRSENDG